MPIIILGSGSTMTIKCLTCISAVIAMAFLCPALQGQDHRYVVFGAGKHGYIDERGSLVIPIALEGTYVLNFSEERAVFAEPVRPTPQKYPYVDKNGKLRIFREEKWGFIDTTGAVAIPPQFDAAMDFHEGLAGVGFDTDRTNYSCTDCDRNQRWGFIDKQGQVVIPAQYRSVRPFSEGLAAIENDHGEWGYIDAVGHLAIPFRFATARSFHDGLAAVAIDKLAGYIDKQGQFVVMPRFTIAGDFSDGLAAVRVGGKTGSIILGPSGGKWAFIRKDGKVQIRLPNNVEQAAGFSEGRAVIEVHGKCGYIDPSGTFAIPVAFAGCGDFSEGLADVFKGGQPVYIDKNGHVALALAHSGIHPFRNGLAAVEEGTSGPTQKFGYIDKMGNLVWEPRPAL